MTNILLVGFGTLTVNVLGCLVIGFLSQLAESRGGFTTFSSFENETLNLVAHTIPAGLVTMEKVRGKFYRFEKK